MWDMRWDVMWDIRWYVMWDMRVSYLLRVKKIFKFHLG